MSLEQDDSLMRSFIAIAPNYQLAAAGLKQVQDSSGMCITYGTKAEDG